LDARWIFRPEPPHTLSIPVAAVVVPLVGLLVYLWSAASGASPWSGGAAVGLGLVLGQLTFGFWNDSGRYLLLSLATIAGLTLVLFLPVIVLDVDGRVADGWNALAPYLALFLAPVPSMIARRRSDVDRGGRG
jgi:hypothetical protein